MTARRRRVSHLSALLVVILLMPALGACTPRLAFASLQNDTTSDVTVLDTWGERAGTVPAGQSGKVEVGLPGHCLPGLLVVTADGRRIATVRDPVCEHDDVVVATDQFVPTGTATIENATGVPFTDGFLGSLELGALGVDERRTVGLPARVGECVSVWLRLTSSDARGVAVAAELVESDKVVICDGDVVTFDPWDVQENVDREWVRRALPPARDPATVTVTNNSWAAIELYLDGISTALVQPGEDAVIEFPAPPVRCSTARLERRGLDDELVPLASFVCAGDHFTMDNRWPDDVIVVTKAP